MNELIERINSTFMERRTDRSLQKDLWKEVAVKFSPDLNMYRHVRPSSIIAKETGDLGLSVLWIVQAALTRPMIMELGLRSDRSAGFENYIRDIDKDTLCALAHSESPSAPVILEKKESSLILNGRKNFITAGTNADKILITCREKGEEKISTVVMLDRTEIPDSSFNDLDLDILSTVSHSGLTLNSFSAEQKRTAAVPPRAVRRCVKKWGIIERALMTEAYLSFLLHCLRFAENSSRREEICGKLQSLLEEQTGRSNRQIDEAVHKDLVETESLSRKSLEGITEFFSDSIDPHRLSEEDRVRVKDISLIRMLG